LQSKRPQLIFRLPKCKNQQYTSALDRMSVINANFKCLSVASYYDQIENS
jgi:hypothetical protein